MINLISFGVVALVLIISLISSIRIVKQNTVLVIERFGKFSRIMNTGLNVKVPFIERVAEVVNMRQQNFGLQNRYPSKDKVIVTITTNLIYFVGAELESITRYVYSLTDRTQSIASFIENSLRTYVAKETHEGILEKKEELATHIRKDLEEQFSKWGMSINSFQITEVSFPATITEAMSQVVASEQLMKAASNQGEAVKIQAVKRAEAEKETKRLQGEGIALEREAIAKGLKESIATIAEATGQKDSQVIALLTLTQYLDTMKSIGSSENSKVIFMDSGINKTGSLMQEIMASMENKGTNDQK